MLCAATGTFGQQCISVPNEPRCGCKRIRDDHDDDGDESLRDRDVVVVCAPKRMRPLFQRRASMFRAEAWQSGVQEMMTDAPSGSVVVGELDNMAALFSLYSEEQELGPRDLQLLCQHIFGFDSSLSFELCALLLEFLLDSKKLYHISREEWRAGLFKYRWTAPKLIALAVLELYKSLDRVVSLKRSFWRFLYHLGKLPGKRLMATDMVEHFLRVFGAALTCNEEFVRFLRAARVEVINEDQWVGYLLFGECYVECSSFVLYHDPAGAWPVLLDEFADWLAARHARPVECD